MPLLTGLFAFQDRLSQISSGFRGSEQPWGWRDLTTLLLMVIGMAAAIWLLSRLSNRRSSRTIDNPRRLFQELCKIHQLNGYSKRFLQDLAASYGVSPLELFVHPKYFRCVNPAERPGAEAALLDSLRQKLFNDGPESTGLAE